MGVMAAMASNPAYKAPYKGVPSYQPKYEPEVPACSKNTTKAWCLEDSEYPSYEVVYALDQHYEAVLALYKNVAVNTANSVDTLAKLEEETYLCPSATSYVQPLRAVLGGSSGKALLPALRETGRIELAYGLLLGLSLGLHR